MKLVGSEHTFGVRVQPASAMLPAGLKLLCEQVDGVGRVQLARTVFNFTDTQDVRVVLGYRMHVDKAGRAVRVRPSGEP